MPPVDNKAQAFESAEAIHARVQSALDWLTEAVAPNEPVSFVPNPGNIGDAAINLSCWRRLTSRFVRVELCPIGQIPTHRNVFIGGGGNLVECLYRRVADFIEALPRDKQLHIFPSTVQGFERLFASRVSMVRIVCREAISYRHMKALVPGTDVFLGHDAALALGPWLRTAFADRMDRLPDAASKPFRRDRERLISENGSLDIMAQYQSDWTDLAWAETTVRLAASYLLGFGHIETDRLHCAILSALLGRKTTLRPNNYFKNLAVYEHSLSCFANVDFNDGSHR